jgi:hypothetical protein
MPGRRPIPDALLGVHMGYLLGRPWVERHGRRILLTPSLRARLG